MDTLFKIKSEGAWLLSCLLTWRADLQPADFVRVDCGGRISLLLSVDRCHCRGLVVGDGNRNVTAQPCRNPELPVSLAAVWAGVAHTRAVRIRAAQDTDGAAAASVASRDS
jgi:hypothetical protein